MSHLVLKIAKVQRLLPIALLTLLVASGSIEAQSGATSSDELSSGAGHARVPFGVASRVKTTDTKRSLNASVDARRGSQLCFLPGVGWQSVPVSTDGDTTGMIETRSSNGTRVNRSTLVGVARSFYKRPSGAGLNSGRPCAGTFSSVTVPGVSKESYGKVMSSINPTGISSGTQVWLDPNSEIDDSLISGIGHSSPERGAMGWNSMVTQGRRVLQGQSSALKKRAYTSPIELRREIRDAPDLITRIRLRRLQVELDQRSRALTPNPTERHSPKGHLTGVFEGKANSSSLNSVRDHVNGSTNATFRHVD
jgi:hypothetical protein